MLTVKDGRQVTPGSPGSVPHRPGEPSQSLASAACPLTVKMQP